MLNDKYFVTAENKSGLSSDETIFHYMQNGNTITGTYSGGAISQGFLVGKQTGADSISLLYQCITTDGELKAGESSGKLSRNMEGKLQIHFDWSWLNGDLSGGKSVYIETSPVNSNNNRS